MDSDVNIEAFTSYIEKFNNDSYNYRYSPTFVTDCTGRAIEQINTCIALYDQLGVLVDSLYDSSATYFETVRDNFIAVELLNMVHSYGGES